MKKFILPFTFVLAVLMYSCNEETLEPTTAQIKDASVGITTVNDLFGISNGMYNHMSKTEYYGRDYILYGEVRSDNCFSNGASGRITTPASMDMLPTDAHTNDTWGRIYKVIGVANLIISKEGTTLSGDQDVMNQVIGEAYAIRALAHFDLLTLYGQQHVTGGNNVGIPYIKEFKGTDLFPVRNTVAEVKGFIYDDLTKALTLMDDALNDDAKQRISTYAVDAIRARVGIYFGDWAIARDASLAVINSGQYKIIEAGKIDKADAYAASFATDSPENSIFELAFSNTDNNNINGIQNIYRGAAYGDVRVLANLRTIFDAGDVRNSPAMIGMQAGAGTSTWLTNIGKYPWANSGDYSSEVIVFRYEEVILNYAEALWRINNADPVALTTLNSIPANRMALAYGAINEDNILKERRRELCFEGFRFNDLARTGKDMPIVDAINQRYDDKGPILYGSYRYAFPIPKNERNANQNCAQNVGYLD
ncbi:MAG: RagB/SusD family nutrient uptake outer membrane protein [Bacteroidales bacterium]|nr:MAG: RagB/SusD family nutrient uptake outer membrane protein [Bacteroidales bacterium]